MERAGSQNKRLGMKPQSRGYPIRQGVGKFWRAPLQQHPGIFRGKHIQMLNSAGAVIQGVSDVKITCSKNEETVIRQGILNLS